jgi:hypothetical protein
LLNNSDPATDCNVDERKARNRPRSQTKRKRGRPRKKGLPRYDNGRLKKATVAQRDERTAKASKIAEIKVDLVLAQPHRRGDDSRLCESPLGHLVLEYRAPPELWVRGAVYGFQYRAWSAAIGAPAPIVQSSLASCIKITFPGPVDWGADTSYEIVGPKVKARKSNAAIQKLRRPIDDADEIIRRAAGMRGPTDMRTLCVDERPAQIT